MAAPGPRFVPMHAAAIAVALLFGGSDVAAQAPKGGDAKASAAKPRARAAPKPAASASGAPATAPPPAPGSAASAGVPTRLRSSIARIADAVAHDLAAISGRAYVIADSPASDAPAPRANDLAALVAKHVASRLSRGGRAHPEPLPLAAAREAARGEPFLIHLAIALGGGQLRVTADAYPVPRTVWARIRDPEPGPIAHAFAQAPIDAEVRSFLPPIPLSAPPRVDRARGFESDVVALACGDLDLDGSLEIVAVSRRRVTTLRLAGGKVQPLAGKLWSDLAPVHPTPLREPFAFATIVQQSGAADGAPDGAHVDIGLTDRAKSVRLDGRLAVVAAHAGLAVPDGDGSACARTWGLVVTGPLAPCAASDPPTLASTVGGRYDAFASAALVTPRGEAFLVTAGREDGVLELRDGSGRRRTIEGVGAQVAIGDLDQDGDPEVIASLDVASPLEDAVVVRTWRRLAEAGAETGAAARAEAAAAIRSDAGAGAEGQAGADLVERARLPAAAGVQALAVCPPDGSGRAPFAVATADEIWVVR